MEDEAGLGTLHVLTLAYADEQLAVAVACGCSQGDPCWRPPTAPHAHLPEAPSREEWEEYQEAIRHCRVADALEERGLGALLGDIPVPQGKGRIVFAGDDPVPVGYIPEGLKLAVPFRPFLDPGFEGEAPQWVGLIALPGKYFH